MTKEVFQILASGKTFFDKHLSQSFLSHKTEKLKTFFDNNEVNKFKFF